MIVKIVEGISNVCRIFDIFAFYFDNVWINFAFRFQCNKLPNSFPSISGTYNFYQKTIWSIYS